MQKLTVRKYLWAFISVFMVCSFSCNAQDTTMADGFFNSGMIAFKKMDFKEAIIDFTEVIKFRKKSPDPYYYRGYSEMMNKQYASAVADFDTALVLNPKDGPSVYQRGLTYSRWEKYDKAIADFNRYEKIKPNDSYGFEGLGFAYLQEKKYDSALYFFNKGMTLDSLNIEMYFYRGFANYKLRKYKEAVPDLKLFLKANPNHSESLNYLMNSEYYINNDSEAIFYADRYLIMNKEDGRAYFLRGQAYFHKAQYDSAASNFTEAIKRKINLAYSFYYRGVCNEKLLLDNNACADFKKAAILGNKNAETLVRNYCE